MLLLIVATSYGKGPKYIFFFIGDGMARHTCSVQSSTLENFRE